MSTTTIDDLAAVLSDSRRLGFLGDRPIPEVIDHAREFVVALRTVNGRVADIGSGGGVPGLVVAFDRPDLQLTLIDRRAKRTDFLSRAVARLRWTDRVRVVASDVDDVEESFDAVIARGFGPPPVTLAAASRLTGSGGTIVISEPPGDRQADGDRWDDAVLRSNGVRRSPSSPSVAVFRRI